MENASEGPTDPRFENIVAAAQAKLQEIEKSWIQAQNELSEAQAKLQEVASARQTIQNHLAEGFAKLQEMELARQKAQSEALFAFQAKQNCEEHSTFISQKKAQAEVELTAINTIKSSIEDFSATLPTRKATVDVDVKAIGDFRRNADENLKQIIDRKSTCDIDQQYVSKIRLDTDAQAAGAKEALVAAQAALAQTEKTAASATSSTEAIERRNAATAALAETITSHASTADSMAKQAAKYATATESTMTAMLEGNTKLTNLLSALETLRTQSEALRVTVEKLLPGATSAGLGSAFRIQGRRHRLPQFLWGACFVGCMAGLYYTAYLTTNAKTDTPMSWDGILLEFLHRLPLLIPLVWLAIFAARKGMLAARLEEDYAHKEALSRAFEGYKAQMQGISAQSSDKNPLLLLCINALNAIAQNPSRIYDHTPKDITIPNEILEAASKQAELLKNAPVAR